MHMVFPIVIRSCEGNKTILTYEDNREEIVDKTCLKYLNDICLRFGSTLAGRQDAYRSLTGYHSKAPALLSERLDTMYFPTVSPSKPDCIWIDESRIVQFKKKDPYTTVLFFTSGVQISIDINIRVIRNQLHRCDTFRTKLFGVNGTV